MYQIADQRSIQQDYCRELEFNAITVRGAVKTTDPFPDQFTVSFVPASLERLLNAYHAIEGGVTFAGTTIRNYDVKCSPSDQAITEPKITLIRDSSAYVLCELTCICKHHSRNFISALPLPVS